MRATTCAVARTKRSILVVQFTARNVLAIVTTRKLRPNSATPPRANSAKRLEPV